MTPDPDTTIRDIECRKDTEAERAQSAFETYPGSLYDYTAGCYCGVLVTEPVMRKLAKLQARHVKDVKRLLTNEAERGGVFPSMWTLHHPNDVQTTVRFIEEGADLYRRIGAACISSPPKHEPLVFVARDMNEAKDMADARHEALCAIPEPKESTDE